MNSEPTGQSAALRQKRPIARVVLPLIISAGIFLILLRFLDSDKLLQAIRRVSLPWYLLSLGIACLSQAVDASRLSLIVRGYAHISTWRVLASRFSGFFYQFFLPGGTGGFAVRWYKINRHAQAPAQVLIAMLYDRILLAFSFTLIGGLALLLDFPFRSNPLAHAALIAYTIVFSTYAVMFWAVIDFRFFKLVAALPLPGFIRRHLAKLEPTVRTATEFPIGLKLLLLGGATTQVILRCIGLALIMKAIGFSLPWLTTIWIRCLVFCVMLIPISFSGLGTRDVLLVTILEPYGVEPEMAIVVATLMFGVFVFFAMLGGIVELFSHQPSSKADVLEGT